MKVNYQQTMRSKALSKIEIAKQLLVHDIRVNGFKAIVYCYGLSASRYVEYACTLAFLLPEIKQGDIIAEIGCGHSILPTLWQRLHLETIALDLNRRALKWQKEKSKKTAKASFLHPILADMTNIPIKNEGINKLSCISAIEHIPEDGDLKSASEIGRIMKNNGTCIISIPLSLREEGYCEKHWATGIPPTMQNLLKFCLPTILRKFNVDRNCTYFERFFSSKDVHKRIIKPSKCLKENYFTLRSGPITKTIHQKIIPTGFLTLLEYMIAKFLKVSKQMEKTDAIILKLRKIS